MAGILRNARTEELYQSEVLTAEHVSYHEFMLKRKKGQAYSTGMLIKVLEKITGEEELPEINPHNQHPYRVCQCAACGDYRFRKSLQDYDVNHYARQAR